MKRDGSLRSRTDYLQFLSARGSLLGLQQSVFTLDAESTESSESKSSSEDEKKRITNIQNSLRAARAVEMAYWRQSKEMQSAQQPSTSAGAKNTEDPKTRGNRFARKKENQTTGIIFIFYLHQLEALEKIYSETRYLTLSKQVALAAELCLTEPQVKYWFRSRREIEKQGETRRTRWDNYDFWSHLKRASGDFSDDEE